MNLIKTDEESVNIFDFGASVVAGEEEASSRQHMVRSPYRKGRRGGVTVDKSLGK